MNGQEKAYASGLVIGLSLGLVFGLTLPTPGRSAAKLATQVATENALATMRVFDRCREQIRRDGETMEWTKVVVEGMEREMNRRCRTR